MLHIGDLETFHFKVTLQIHLSCRVPGGPGRSMGVPRGSELCRMTGLTWRDHVERNRCDASRWWVGTAPPSLPGLMDSEATKGPGAASSGRTTLSTTEGCWIERVAHNMAKCSDRVWKILVSMFFYSKEAFWCPSLWKWIQAWLKSPLNCSVL